MGAPHEITWHVEDRPLADDEVAEALDAALEHGGRAGLRLSVALVDDAALAALHAEHLGDPSPTDVMAFDLGDEGGGPAGEVVVSVERARAEAERRGRSVADELELYLVHGALHLCGFDDREPGARARMRRAERAVLARLARREP